MIEQYNQPEWDFQLTDDHDFINLRGLVDEKHMGYVHIVRGLYINSNDEYGDAPVAITDTHLVNLPAHLTKTVREILSAKRNIAGINDGKVGFTIKEYENKYGKQLTVTWVTVKP